MVLLIAIYIMTLLSVNTHSFTCATASFISLLFTTQNNGVKWYSIEHRENGNTWACVVAYVWLRVARLRSHGTSVLFPLSGVYYKNKWLYVVPKWRRPSERQSKLQAHKWGSNPTRSLQYQCVMGDPWWYSSISGHRHHPYDGGVAERFDYPLTPHIHTYLHVRSDVAHGTAWELYTNNARSRGLRPLLPKYGPLIDLSWG